MGIKHQWDWNSAVTTLLHNNQTMTQACQWRLVVYLINHTVLSTYVYLFRCHNVMETVAMTSTLTGKSICSHKYLIYSTQTQALSIFHASSKSPYNWNFQSPISPFSPGSPLLSAASGRLRGGGVGERNESCQKWWRIISLEGVSKARDRSRHKKSNSMSVSRAIEQITLYKMMSAQLQLILKPAWLAGMFEFASRLNL